MTIRYHRLKDVALAVMFGAMLTACSEESVQDMQPNHELRLYLGAQHFTPETRTLPAGFEAYPYTTPSDVQIQGYLTTDESGAEPFQGVFSPTASGLPRWTSRMKINEANSNYYFYGFLPKRAGNTASIALNTSLTPPVGETLSYKHGATLTINGLSAISADDVCVVVGVKAYNTSAAATDTPPAITAADPRADMTNRWGKFDVSIEDDVTNVYLLVDHIYSRLVFNLKVSDKYSKLRTIKVKRMTLMSGDNALNVVKTVRATVNIGATDGTQSPISGDDAHKIQLSTETLGQPEPPTELFANETTPLVLTTTAQSVQAFFAASSIERFILETTYDVYDATGTDLIREDQTTQNIFSVSGQALESGQQSSFIITVDPTYIYVLADPDVDSPTFTLQ